MRIADFIGIGQVRTGNDVNQYSYDGALVKAGVRPDLFPTDTTPMEVVTCDPNPGEAELLKEGEILPLQPVGARSVLVYPGVVPAPDITTDMAYEDRYPRDMNRTILRGQTGVSPWGPWPPPRGIEQTMGFLGQPETTPAYFPYNPEDVAYQTYPGPSLGQDSSAPAQANSRFYPPVMTMVVGGAITYVSLAAFRGGLIRDMVAFMGLVAGGIGLANLISEATK